MNAQNFWELFLETGSPELYVLYSHAKKVEKRSVFNGQGTGSESNKL